MAEKIQEKMIFSFSKTTVIKEQNECAHTEHTRFFEEIIVYPVGDKRSAAKKTAVVFGVRGPHFQHVDRIVEVRDPAAARHVEVAGSPFL